MIFWARDRSRRMTEKNATECANERWLLRGHLLNRCRKKPDCERERIEGGVWK